MDRRLFTQQLACAFTAAGPLAAFATPSSIAPWTSMEQGPGGRLGVAVLDTGTGALEGQRLDERFPMCSTFKWLAAAYVLHRVDRGQEQLDRRIRYDASVLLPHSPVTEQHVGDGMHLGALCEATIATSDNAAANLILESYGGPQALTRYIRSLGDAKTRLDRREPALNSAIPGDPRDTTTPRAMAATLRRLLTGDALSAESKVQLLRWMLATRTNLKRLRAGLPEGWEVGSKTGTGANGSTNDVGIFFPPKGRAPVVVAVYLTQSKAELAVREAAIAAVAQRVTASY